VELSEAAGLSYTDSQRRRVHAEVGPFETCPVGFSFYLNPPVEGGKTAETCKAAEPKISAVIEKMLEGKARATVEVESGDSARVTVHLYDPLDESVHLGGSDELGKWYGGDGHALRPLHLLRVLARVLRRV
ncbi:MAG: hypothetical protein FWG11_00190, partial [Promicromonosporaceae bacterium]|nr:hypothetical protein [Promicromonosporaceae bacterium]